MDRIFKESDFVKYQGDNSVVGGPLRNPGIGIIRKFKEFNGQERIYVFLIDRNETIVCDFDKISQIETKPKHLIKAGFVEEVVGHGKRYRVGKIIVSKRILHFQIQALFFLTGFCVADLTGNIELGEDYYQNGRFKTDRFYEEYKAVNNVNELFEFLRSRGFILDWQTIACL
jgi:hypothetical protein